MKILLIALFLISTTLLSKEISLKSQETQTQVIELYTSEGCSSCPPADRWLSSLKSSSELFQTFIPLSFHVDYWDYIGWKDELALAQNSNRQRQHKQDNNLNTIYTPGVLKTGKEWRRWYRASISESKNKVGSLSIELKNNKLTAIFDAINQSEYKLVVALLGMNIQTKVSAGENHGKTLMHDFVVLKLQSFGSSPGVWQEKLPEEFFHTKFLNTAFVAWVEVTSNPTPVQAVATFL